MSHEWLITLLGFRGHRHRHLRRAEQEGQPGGAQGGLPAAGQGPHRLRLGHPGRCLCLGSRRHGHPASQGRKVRILHVKNLNFTIEQLEMLQPQFSLWLTVTHSSHRYGGLSRGDDASAARMLARLGVTNLAFESPPSSQETLEDRWINGLKGWFTW